MAGGLLQRRLGLLFGGRQVLVSGSGGGRLRGWSLSRMGMGGLRGRGHQDRSSQEYSPHSSTSSLTVPIVVRACSCKRRAGPSGPPAYGSIGCQTTGAWNKPATARRQLTPGQFELTTAHHHLKLPQLTSSCAISSGDGSSST